MLARPEFDPHTDEIVGDTPDLDLARKARSIGPDVYRLAKSSEGTTRHRVRRHQRTPLRSLERIKARHKRRSRSDRGVRQQPPYPPSTAQDSMSLGDNVGESGEARSFRTESVTSAVG